MSDWRPKKIRIMPDYGPSYASDEDGDVFDLSDCFADHPRLAEIKEIEDQLYGLADWINSGAPDNDPEFPWADLDEKGLALAKRLARLLSDLGIPVFYQFHYNNPRFAMEEEVDVSALED